MSPHDIIRAWRDPEYRLSLSEAERALLPDHPAGFIEITDAELDQAAGGTYSSDWTTILMDRCPHTMAVVCDDEVSPA